MPRLRPFTWIILAINVLFLVWIIRGTASAGSQPCPPGLSPEACTAASQVGTGIGAALIIALWVAVDIILGILWLITRPKRRDCRVCGYSAKRGVTTCTHCNTPFATTAPVT